MKDFMGRPLFGGDRVIFTHTMSGGLHRGIIIKPNDYMSTIKLCKPGTWEPDLERRWSTETKCSNGNILKYNEYAS